MSDESWQGQEIAGPILPVQIEQVSLFNEAIGGGYAEGQIPPTFVTRFREGEHEWLSRLNVDMRYLLHGDQEYEFLKPVPLNTEGEVVSRVKDVKRREGRQETMCFIRLESEMKFSGELHVISRTTFVVRIPKEGAKG